jgi:hypothetical protein
MAQASWERLAEITSGRTGFQQGFAATCKDLGRYIPEKGTGLAHELVGARKKG